MIFYKSTVKGFKASCFTRDISEVVEQAFVKSTGHRVRSPDVNASVLDRFAKVDLRRHSQLTDFSLTGDSRCFESATALRGIIRHV